MRGDDKFYLGIGLCIMDEFGLIVFPGTSCNQYFAISAKLFNNGKRFKFSRYFNYPVKPCISRNSDSLTNAEGGQQVFRSFVLHKKMGETFQHLSPYSTIPFKKCIAFPEDTGYQQNRD